MIQNILEMKQICKAFNQITVLKNVDFTLKAGEIHALMGGNGAGKSTLMKILTGVYQADDGSIAINAKEVSIAAVQDSINNGISMIFQEFSLIPTLTVAENIFLTRETLKFGFIDDQQSVKITEEILKQVGIDDLDPNAVVNELGVGYWQLTEIAKALSQQARILIMDEPTSSLTKSETEKLFKLMRQLKQKGISIIYISHRMEEIFQICDHVTVLRDGGNVFSSKISDTNMVEIIDNMIGSTNSHHSFVWKERQVKRTGEPVFEVRQLYSGRRVQNVSLKVYAGEILGIAGLMGSGRTELFRAMFGIQKIDSGEIWIRGKRRMIHSPQDAIKDGIAMIPENRRKQGLILDHSVKDNMILPTLHRLVNKWLIDDKKGEREADQYISRLNIKTDHLHRLIKLLSGGNQQKVVLAKWLMDSPNILLLDEPTIGVDIGAKMEIVEIIRQLADQGKAVIVVSSELTELLAISDRIMILKDGSVQKELNRADIESEEVLHHAIQ